MSNSGSGRKKTSRSKVEKSDDYEVNQLLQSAQDELLLKLSVDSHMSRVSPDYLIPDLDRRFQALKSRPTTTAATSKPATVVKSSQQQQQKPHPPPAALESDDLFARFAALKASSSSSVNGNGIRDNAAKGSVVFDQRDDDDDDDEDDEEDEVEKIIMWAKDAARLDPSPPSDDDVDDDSDLYESDQDLENVNKMDGPEKGKSK